MSVFLEKESSNAMIVLLSSNCYQQIAKNCLVFDTINWSNLLLKMFYKKAAEEPNSVKISHPILHLRTLSLSIEL